MNPGTSDGVKLYMKATVSINDEDKFDINISNAQKFLDNMTGVANNIGWRILARIIQLEITDTRINITELDMKRQAYKIWGDHLITYQGPVPNGYDLQHIMPEQNPAHIKTFF